MPRFLVEREVHVIRQEMWEVDEENAEEAGWNYFDGELLNSHEKVYDATIIDVEERA